MQIRIPLIMSLLLAAWLLPAQAVEGDVSAGAAQAGGHGTNVTEGGTQNGQNSKSSNPDPEKAAGGTRDAKKRAGVEVRKPESLPPLPPPPTTFEAASKELFPMTGDEIRRLRRLLDENQRAAAEPPSAPAKPVTSTLIVKSDPGATPPIVRLGTGFVSSMVFVDSTGAPWPVSSVSPGDPSKFTVEQAGQGEESTNVLTLTPQSAFMHSNLVVMLRGRFTPLTLTLVSGQREVDYRVDVSVDGRGPNAAAPVITGDSAFKTNPAVQQVLDGVRPQKSRELKVTGADARAFALGGKIYLRAKMSVQSPAWSAHASSPDGTHVYEIPEVPVVLALVDGRQIELNIEGISWKSK